MIDIIGVGVIIFIVSFIIGVFIAVVIQNIRYWLDRKAEAKKIIILPDGKGGYITLPKGATYIPIKGENK